MSDARRRALAQFFVDEPTAPQLTATDDHHLRRVLRARPGEHVVVCDGHGRWALATVGPDGLDRVSEVCVDPAPRDTTLYLAPLKGDRSEWAVAKATELGVTRVVPLRTTRAVVRLDADSEERLVQRWTRVAREAAAQARRPYLLEIGSATRVADVPATVAVADFGGPHPWSRVDAVAIGPEGGWAPDEWDATRPRVSLGALVLRAETAALAAATLMTLGRLDGGVGEGGK